MKTTLFPLAKRLLNDQGFDNLRSFGRELTDTFVHTYQTAVGPKVATIQIRERNGFMYFSAQYWSEGRNILAGCSAVKFIKTDIEYPEHWIMKFILDVDYAVRDSYAARLA
jgi:hypothetical protein